MRKIYLSCLTILLSITGVWASGYQVLLQSSRTVGMGNLNAAIRPDASSVFFNPGAMGFMGYNGAMIGASFIDSRIRYWNSTEPNSSYNVLTDNPTGTPFHAFVSWGAEGSPWKFGFAAVTPFGSGVKWQQGWIGNTLLDELTLRSIQFHLAANYKINDKFGIGAAFVINTGSVNIQRTAPIDNQNIDGIPGSIELDGNSDTGFGYTIGAFWKVSEKLNIGVDYRSRIDAEVKGGDATFTNFPVALQTSFANTKFDAKLPLPSVTSLGFNFMPTEKWEIGFQVDFVGWSAYDSLIIDFQDNTDLLEDSRSPRKYEDSWVFHLGGAYQLNEWTFRAGGYYDLTPVQKGYMTAETPDANRTGLTLGVGYTIAERVQIDASFLYIMGQQREQTLENTQNAGTYDPDTGAYDVQPGTYKLRAYIPGISIAFNF